jgi:hypothetical protein
MKGFMTQSSGISCRGNGKSCLLHGLKMFSVIPGRVEDASPESKLTMVVMDSGAHRFAMSRNDDVK